MDNTHINTLEYISDREVRLTRGCLNNKHTEGSRSGLFQGQKEKPLQLKEENDAMRLQRQNQGWSRWTTGSVRRLWY